MPINTGSFAKLLYPGLNKIYGQNYTEYPLECMQIFEEQQTSRAYEEDLGVTGFGMAAVKGEGNAIAYDTEQQAFLTRYTPTVYALGFIITEEMMDDDLYDTIGSRRTEGLAYSMRQNKETVHANIFKDRKSVVEGKSVEHGGGRKITKKKKRVQRKRRKETSNT